VPEEAEQPEGVGGAGGGGEVLELGGHGLDESHGKALAAVEGDVGGDEDGGDNPASEAEGADGGSGELVRGAVSDLEVAHLEGGGSRLGAAEGHGAGEGARGEGRSRGQLPVCT